MKIRFPDILIIAFSLLVVVAVSVFAYGGGAQQSSLIIESSGNQWIYSLSGDRTIRVPGPLGDTIVVISGNKAFVQDSPCRDKLCVLVGAISKPGQWTACLPNKVMVRIGGAANEAPDDSSF